LAAGPQHVGLDLLEWGYWLLGSLPSPLWNSNPFMWFRPDLVLPPTAFLPLVQLLQPDSELVYFVLALIESNDAPIKSESVEKYVAKTMA